MIGRLVLALSCVAILACSVTALAAHPGTLAAPCLATAVHGEPLPESGTLSQLPWVQAVPHRAGIVGVLFAYDPRLETAGSPTFALWTSGAAPEGSPAMKILWIARNVHAAGRIVVSGRELTGTGRFTQRFAAVTDASSQPARGVEYASIVKIPHAGCWQLDVSAGARVRGSFAVRAVSP